MKGWLANDKHRLPALLVPTPFASEFPKTHFKDVAPEKLN